MRIGAHERIGIGDFDILRFAAFRRKFFLTSPNSLGEIFEIDLMANAGARGHDAEIVERALAPFQETITFAIAGIFEIDIGLESLGAAEGIDDDRVVDHEIDRNQRIDFLRIATELGHGVAHGGKIDHSRNASEILHQNTGRTEGDLAFRLAFIGEPFGNRLNILFGNRAAIFVTQKIFEQDLHRKRQFRNAGKPVLFRRFQRKIMIGFGTDAELFAAFETVERGHRNRPGIEVANVKTSRLIDNFRGKGYTQNRLVRH